MLRPHCGRTYEIFDGPSSPAFPAGFFSSLQTLYLRVCGRIGRLKRVGPALMSRLYITGFALACAATALAACGVTPREERSERSTLSRTYPV
jgi:hypothetical protein